MTPEPRTEEPRLEEPRADLRADVEALPTALRALADALDAEGDRALLAQAGPFLERTFTRYRLTGVGASLDAARWAAARMRALGLNAAAEPAGSTDAWPMHPDTLTVAVSASGTSTDLLDALDRLDGHFPVLALTNDPRSPLAQRAGAVLPLTAGTLRSRGGLRAVRTTPPTLVLLSALASAWSGGRPRMVARDAESLARRAADAVDHLLAHRDGWLPAAVTALTTGADSPTLWCLAPAERRNSADLAARTFREGPGWFAAAGETRDLDARARGRARGVLIFDGDDDRTPPPGTTAAIVVGTKATGATAISLPPTTTPAPAAPTPGRVVVRYPDDDDPMVALVAETAVAALLAGAVPWR